MTKENGKHFRSFFSEKFAIVTCGVVIAVFAIPLLVVIQALAASIWGTTTVFQMLQGEALFDEENEFNRWE